jgi:hypothetical protein
MSTIQEQKTQTLLLQPNTPINQTFDVSTCDIRFDLNLEAVDEFTLDTVSVSFDTPIVTNTTTNTKQYSIMNPNIGGRKNLNVVFKSSIEQRIRIQTVQNKTASALQWFAPSDVKEISSKMPEPAVNINPTDVSTVSTSSTQATEGSWTKTIGVVLILIMFAVGGYYYYYYYNAQNPTAIQK